MFFFVNMGNVIVHLYMTIGLGSRNLFAEGKAMRIRTGTEFEASATVRNAVQH